MLAIHRDLVNHTLQWTTDLSSLAFQSKALRLLHEQLPSVATGAVDYLLYAVICLSRLHGEPATTSQSLAWPFVPYLPYANGMHIYRRTQLIDARRDGISNILNLQGGLHNLRMPGLADRLALIDLVAASTTGQKSMLPCFWSHEEDADRPAWHSTIKLNPMQDFQRLAEHLPETAIDVFTNLAHVTSDMERHDVPLTPLNDLDRLLSERNATHYNLLSLTPDVSAAGMQVQPLIYFSCRLTCILFSNAVLIGIPPDLGWHKPLVLQLQSLLENIGTSSGAKWLDEMLLWSAFTAGIAAYHLPQRRFFVRQIRALCQTHHISSWDGAEQILSTFLWSKRACGFCCCSFVGSCHALGRRMRHRNWLSLLN